MSQEPATTEPTGDGAGAAASGDLPQGTVSPEDEARRRFREALDKKKFAHRSGQSAGGPHAQHPHTAPAKPQKTFRRKSG